MNGFISRLEVLMEKRKINRADLCRELSIPYTTMQNYYRGSVPSADVALKIAKYFDIPLELLLTGKAPLVPNSDGLTELDEMELNLVKLYRSLDDVSKNAFLEMISVFVTHYGISD